VPPTPANAGSRWPSARVEVGWQGMMPPASPWPSAWVVIGWQGMAWQKLDEVTLASARPSARVATLTSSWPSARVVIG